MRSEIKWIESVHEKDKAKVLLRREFVGVWNELRKREVFDII